MQTNTAIGVAVAVIVVLLGAYFMFGSAGGTNLPTTSQSPVTSGENAQPGDQVHGLPPEPAAVAARKDLAAKLGVGEGSITIMQVADMTWTDGCLGLGGPAESCLQALVEGFRVELLAQGKTYFYRTDKTGASVRAEAQ